MDIKPLFWTHLNSPLTPVLHVVVFRGNRFTKRIVCESRALSCNNTLQMSELPFCLLITNCWEGKSLMMTEFNDKHLLFDSWTWFKLASWNFWNNLNTHRVVTLQCYLSKKVMWWRHHIVCPARNLMNYPLSKKILLKTLFSFPCFVFPLFDMFSFWHVYPRLPLLGLHLVHCLYVAWMSCQASSCSSSNGYSTSTNPSLPSLFLDSFLEPQAGAPFIFGESSSSLTLPNNQCNGINNSHHNNNIHHHHHLSGYPSSSSHVRLPPFCSI